MITVVVIYDIATASSNGRKRLRKVSSICQNWGTAVQKSVYECKVDAEQLRKMQNELMSSIDQKADKLRFYYLGKHSDVRTKSIGVSQDDWDRETFVI